MKLHRGMTLFAVAIVSLLTARCSQREADEHVQQAGEALVSAVCAATTLCSDQHRDCAELGGQPHCGPCSTGFAESAKRTCDPQVTCASLNCGASNRTCQEIPNAFCKDECVAGYVWDVDLRACRLPKTCDDVACAATQQCRQTAATDAECFGSECAAGQGWDPKAKACVTCAGGNAPVCGMELDGQTVRPGETGNIIAVAGGQCVCEARDGYFVPAGGTGAVACDADSDGWVNDNAESTLEGADAALKANARCHVRRVSKIVLQADEGTANDATAEDFQTPFGGLPLYESARNDGASVEVVPAPYGSLGNGKAVNSLTKACVGLVEDFNANGVVDVDEDQTANIDSTLKAKLGANDKLLAYYRAYARYSYFVEMESGWYEPPATAGQSGTYRIQERRRTDGASVGLPVTYPAGTPDYWKECGRQADVLYTSASSKVGGDFTSSKLGTFAGTMGHESQFKCVVIHQDGQYPAGVNELTQPEAFAVSGAGKLERKNSQGAFHELGWAVDNCSPVDVSSPKGLSTTNPLIASINCTQIPTLDHTKTTVAWAAVTGYEYDSAGNYQRGCVDMCKTSTNGGCGDPATAVCNSLQGGRTCSCTNGYTPLPNRTQISVRSTGRCFDDWFWTKNAGTTDNLRGYKCENVNDPSNNHINQQWVFIPTDNGFAQIVDAFSNLCLEVTGSGENALVQQNTCNMRNEQQFLVEPVDGQGGFFRLRPRHSMKCLHIGGSADPTAAVTIDQETCAADDANMMFSFPQNSSVCRPINRCDASSNGGCPSGYTCQDNPMNVSVSCIQIDYCGNKSLQNPQCSGNASCQNVPGGYRCTCNSPYAGDGYTCAIPDFCANEHRSCPNGYCYNTTTGSACGCNSGYEWNGSQCVWIDPCRGKRCPKGMYCSSDTGVAVCEGDPCGKCGCGDSISVFMCKRGLL